MVLLAHNLVSAAINCPDRLSKIAISSKVIFTALISAAEVSKEYGEPMPGWNEADRNKLETIPHCTETGAGDWSKYPDLSSKAAKLFYHAIKIHAFPNGNKRFAVAATMLLLLRHGMSFKITTTTLVNLATGVAESNEPSDQVIETLASGFTSLISDHRL